LRTLENSWSATDAKTNIIRITELGWYR